MTPSTVVHFGNPVPHKPITANGEKVGHEALPDSQPSVTEVGIEPGEAEALRANRSVIEASLESGGERYRSRCHLGIVQREHMSEADTAVGHILYVLAGHAREGLSWVSAEDKELEAVLGKIFDCKAAPNGTSESLLLARHEGGSWDEITKDIQGPTALKTRAGVGVIAGNSFGEAATVAQLNYFALTANTEAPAATNTSLAGEIATAGGGLIRKKATYAFTEATGILTLTVTFTANGSDVFPVTVAKFGVLNKAESGGTMGIETKLTATVTFAASGDNMTLTETLEIK